MVMTQTSLFSFILHAGLVVKLVMFILLLASVFSWMFILQRYWAFRQIRRGMEQFMTQFWSGGDIQALFERVQQEPRSESLSYIFQSGFGEYLRLRERPSMSANARMENIERAMRIAANKEIEKCQDNLNFLATVGSVSPYVGLFGTVWGIMTSFSSLGSVQQATIAMVAPGISEALIATAFGLFAAIPAVIAFNRFTHGVDSVTNQIDNFCEELMKLLHREVYQ